MIIKPDPEGSNEPNTFRYYEELTNEGYYYEVYILADDEKACVFVTDDGVSVEFLSGKVISTNITPQRLFPKHKSLEWDGELERIIKTLRDTDMEGQTFSPEEIQELHDFFMEGE